MKIIEMRGLSGDELNARVTAWEEDLFRARCNQAVGQLGNTNVLRGLRRDIARAKTLITEMKRSEKSSDAAK